MAGLEKNPWKKQSARSPPKSLMTAVGKLKAKKIMKEKKYTFRQRPKNHWSDTISEYI